MRAIKSIYINPIVNTEIFLRFVNIQAQQFKKQKGFGRWLAEYKRMEEHGLFEPSKIKEQYISIINNNYKFGFIYSHAIEYICSNTIDSIKYLLTGKTYTIKTVYGDVAEDEEGKEITGLQLDEALCLCKDMNIEADEIMFKVFTGNILIN